MPRFGAVTHPIVGHSTQISVANPIGHRQVLDVGLQGSKNGERAIMLALFERPLAAREAVSVRRARADDENPRKQPRGKERTHRRPA